MSDITGLNWPTDKIDVYVSFYAPYSFSHPLTVKPMQNYYKRIVLLTHELAHILFWCKGRSVLQIRKKKGIFKKYVREKKTVKIHIPAEALVQLTMKRAFKRNWKRYIFWETHWWQTKKSKRAKLYRRAWEIMEKEGAENIIKDVVKQWKEKN